MPPGLWTPRNSAEDPVTAPKVLFLQLPPPQWSNLEGFPEEGAAEQDSEACVVHQGHLEEEGVKDTL